MPSAGSKSPGQPTNANILSYSVDSIQMTHGATFKYDEKKLKSVNIWQSYKQERGCLMNFARLANTLLKYTGQPPPNAIPIQLLCRQYKCDKA